MTSKFLVLGSLMIGALLMNAQSRTVGLISYDESQALPGYNLLFPHNQSDVYLLNNCGEIVHTWQSDSGNTPGNSVYLREDGSIVKCSRSPVTEGDFIWAGGGGGIVEALDWDGNLLWSFTQNDSLKRLHHDIELMPNGNVLMISWELRGLEECLLAGRDPDKLFQDKLWPDYILEYDPSLDSIVWEWHIWDHLIQDFDSTKVNFGVITENPGKININYETNLGNPDWNHANAIDYNPELDQILLSVPTFDEVWIIDHSTSTEEARSTIGGRSGKGGELLYRWGNPKAFEQGDTLDQRLFFQHDAHWILDEVDQTDQFYNKILLFNNRVGEDFSAVNIINPTLDNDSVNYVMDVGRYLPLETELTLTHPVKQKLYSTGLSSAQYLSNGNFLILAGRIGYAFEITPSNEIVWEYVLPLKAGSPVQQGTELTLSNNNLFRLKRYSADYPAFEGRDLTPKGLLQIEEDNDLCSRIVSIDSPLAEKPFELFPNPFQDVIHIVNKNLEALGLVIYDLQGLRVKELKIQNSVNELDLSDLSAGLYIFQIEGHFHKMIKQ